MFIITTNVIFNLHNVRLVTKHEHDGMYGLNVDGLFVGYASEEKRDEIYDECVRHMENHVQRMAAARTSNSETMEQVIEIMRRSLDDTDDD